MSLHALPALDIQFAPIVASSSGATQIVAGLTVTDILGRQYAIRVVSLQWVANGIVNVKWQSHVTPTDLTGLAYAAANGGIVLPYNPAGWFQTLPGEGLDINLSGNVAVGGCLSYIVLPALL